MKSSAKVYYLDDEVQLCEAFARFMRLMGHDVTTFTTAVELIQACQSAPPDVLFLDYRLTGTTGTQVAQKLEPGIKKVLVTGDLAVADTEGFVEILLKPFRLQQANELIARLCPPTTPPTV